MSLVGEWDIIGTTRENSSIYLIMANREEQLKQITEQLEQGVAEIFTSEKYTTTKVIIFH